VAQPPEPGSFRNGFVRFLNAQALFSAGTRAIVSFPVTLVKPCGICGGLVRSDIPLNLHPRKKAAVAESDMQAHLRTHSFAELLRFEIRQDLEEVPEDQRPVIVRDIYRSLLGTTTGTCFTLGETDGLGVYAIDDVLGDIELYRLWRSANSCGDPGCQQHQKG